MSASENDANKEEQNELEAKLDEGYAALAADPEYQQEQKRRKVMRGIIRRRSAIKLRWPEN